jgi:nucleoside-diphosphate-sugar epimerase
MGMYDRDGDWPVYANQPVRPDSLYGVSKAFGENLGRHYSDRYGISVICLRIGWFLPQPRDEISRWMWLSPRDCAQLVTLSLESTLPFGVFYAISGNSGRHWDITDTIEKLGYRPQDDADEAMRG